MYFGTCGRETQLQVGERVEKITFPMLQHSSLSDIVCCALYFFKNIKLPVLISEFLLLIKKWLTKMTNNGRQSSINEPNRFVNLFLKSLFRY